MDLAHAPNLAKGLLESVGARLQHLQLVLYVGEWNDAQCQDFWRALGACTLIAGLQLIFTHVGEARHNL